MDHVTLCFVCTGNICRSPTAEGVMRKLVDEAKLSRYIGIDSAGTIDYHSGELADSRARRAAAARGVKLTHRARQLTADDFRRFDFLLAMDGGHLAILERRAPKDATAKLILFRSFDPTADDRADVPDPYYGDDAGFEEVLDMSERACKGLLEHLLQNYDFKR